MRRRTLLATLLAGTASTLAHGEGREARVAAASDLQFALPEMAASFERQSGQQVTISFGSSGNLARQIEQGAPIDLFLSADESFARRLTEAGRTRDAGAVYAVGRIACIVPRNAATVLDERLDGLRRGIDAVRRFAIANPEHAPYGRAAREALEHLGLWDLLQSRLVLGENIAQTTQYVVSGVAQAGITSLSLAVAADVAAHTRHVLLPDSLHAPLRQRMVLLRNARPAAAQFYDFLLSPPVRAAWARHGLGSPREPR